jgi:hypothetical protein
MNRTPRLGLPFLSAGQAQKEILVNESLQTLDILVAGTVEEAPRDAPPTDPTAGACYIAGPTPTGAWTGKPQNVAAFTTGGWLFIEPREGMTFQVLGSGTCALFRAGAWELGEVRGSRLVLGGQQVVGERTEPIGTPLGGATVDGEARAAIDQILAALRQHGLIDA